MTAETKCVGAAPGLKVVGLEIASLKEDYIIDGGYASMD